MSRNIDLIVRNHKVARERRLAVRPVWDMTIRIKDVIGADVSNEAVLASADAVAKRLVAGTPESWRDENALDFDDDLYCIIDELRSLKDESHLLAAYNDLLSWIYDWADEKRVWLA